MNKIVNNQTSAIARASAREEVDPMTSKKKYKRNVSYTKKPIVNKLMLIDKLMKSQDEIKISLTVGEFKELFSIAQLKRGWVKPQLEFFNERVKNGT